MAGRKKYRPSARLLPRSTPTHSSHRSSTHGDRNVRADSGSHGDPENTNNNSDHRDGRHEVGRENCRPSACLSTRGAGDQQTSWPHHSIES